MARLDPELLEAFAPEFESAAADLALAGDAAAAGRALDRLRGMAAALEAPSLAALLADAAAHLDPLDLPALHAAAATLAARAAAIAAAGEDLPAAPPRPAELSPAQPPAQALAGPAPRRVLVVDDSAMMRRLVRESLALDPGFEVVGEAADGAEALALMRSLAPDLTLLDIEMPVLDGIGVLRRWALEGEAGAVVVVSSAVPPGSPTARLARRLGAAGVVGKPSGAFSPDLAERQGEALRRAARRASGLAEGG